MDDSEIVISLAHLFTLLIKIVHLHVYCFSLYQHTHTKTNKNNKPCIYNLLSNLISMHPVDL